MNIETLNHRLEAAKPSATYKIIDRVAERRGEGATIISLCAGEPDFDTPEHIRAAAINAINDGHTRYTQVAGLRALREAIARKYRCENGLAVEWNDTLVCSGGKQVIFNALAATLNEGDEVIIPAPYWVSYPEMVQLCGGESRVVACGAESGFKLTPQALAQSIGPNTRWLILNSPSNPTGAVYDQHELQGLAEVLLAHPQVLVLADDIYEHLIFDGRQFQTLAQVEPRLAARTLTMNGVSKAYAMTGWRIGFATGPRWLLEAMEKLQGQQISGACSISQHAAIAALDGPKEFIAHSQKVFQRRRDFMVDLLNQIPGIRCQSPGGAFYAFADCTGLIGKRSQGGRELVDDEAVALALLEEANVAVVHGSAFGLAGYLRIAYALDDQSLRQACQAVGSFCENAR
ncbi:pyridoxal phosphate-dependent aminotransferase [Pseudomonas sp. 21LCFQ02]|uniref:pyridoxal phosphate-dependent aminotransferase n=1 Tax=Pseudomonas sp. 21LCFQ02 TaxID=2957505 RepID=UPI00209B07E5|nr:pyridoxal phosphate-dependent aminotransferase [Pseudomonas sp. 21LCFQ02]MCO8168637.1 pyridoxal phosphate-dependent aminotransferase [Pseudomonas sp. 21LCFQ02]